MPWTRPMLPALLPMAGPHSPTPHCPPDPRVTDSPGVSLLCGAARCHTGTSRKHGLLCALVYQQPDGWAALQILIDGGVLLDDLLPTDG